MWWRAWRPQEGHRFQGAQGRRTLGLAVVHAVLAGQRLDEALQRAVPPHVVAAPDRALNLRQRLLPTDNHNKKREPHRSALNAPVLTP